MTREEAIALYKTNFWEHLSFRERAEFQLFERRLCMPFDVFHEAIEKTLGRPVFTHEFGLNREGLKMELMHGTTPPSLQEILEMIPKEKRIILKTE